MNRRHLLLGLLFIFFSSCLMKPMPFDEAEWLREIERQRPVKLYEAHFEDGKYSNPWTPPNRHSFWSFLRWRLSKKTAYSDEEWAYQAVVRPNLKDRIKATPKVDFITWIGHGTFLLRLEEEYWLIDPIFTDRALLPKRVTPPAMSADQLKELTNRVNVIISHNHYDHLDVESVRSLPIGSAIFVPKGLKDYIHSFYEGPVQELDWWESVGLDIGNRFPDIHYALLPVTAYEPRWFMHTYHMSPSEAIKAFEELGADYFIPTQWGAFHLGDNPPGKPALDLIKIVKGKNLDPSQFIIMDIGQIEVIREKG